MNTKALFVGLGVVLILGAVAVLGWLFIQMTQSDADTVPEPAPSNPFGFSTSVTDPEPDAREGLAISTREGGQVLVPDFTNGREPIAADDGAYYFLYGPEFSTEGYAFSAQYAEAGSAFLIVLLEEPIGASRLAAEAYLKDLLQLPEETLCSLSTRIVVGADINASYARYGNLGLSFCAGAVPLP